MNQRDRPNLFPEKGFVLENIDLSSVDARLQVLVQAVEAANNCVVLANAQVDDLPLVYVNQGFCRVTGYDRQEILGKNCRFLQSPPPGVKQVDVEGFDPTKQQRELAGIRRALREQRTCAALLQNFRKDGQGFWNELYLTPVFDQDTCVAIIGVQNDVTDRVSAQHRLLAVQANERKRLAGDLHDTVCADLAALSLRAQVLVSSRGSFSPEELTEELRALDADARSAALGARRISHRLMPANTQKDLSADLENLAERSAEIWQIDCHFQATGDPLNVDEETRLHLLRIVQEAISNAVRSGSAKTVRITLATTPGNAPDTAAAGNGDGHAPAPSADDDDHESTRAPLLVLTVQDDGTGLPSSFREARDGSLAGIGIESMRTRADLIGGEFSLDDHDGGAIVTVRVHGLAAHTDAIDSTAAASTPAQTHPDHPPHIQSHH